MTGRIALAGETLVAVWLAAKIRFSGRTAELELPPPSSALRLPAEQIEPVCTWVAGIVYLLVFGRRRRCFYRSYALARILRRRGVPVLLNLGYRNLRSNKRKQAHCWLTLEGELFRENATTRAEYPIRLGGVEGQVDYYLGGES